MKKLSALFLALLALNACMPYGDYYRLDEDYLARRQLETSRFETDDEKAILSASAQVLQDMGFTIDESETKLGLITASKNREAGSTGVKVLMVLFGGQNAVYDTEQKIYTTLVSTKSRESKGFNVRVEFARIVWDNRGQARIEKIEDPEVYRDFFDKLGSSLFLTAHSI
ncbi:MAG: hypothetical protein LBH92_01470 [Bacteroidales bacterium]|jgi:hypothetical protein|nr:hypothetical protein [Bacteroidales bacterium]